MNTAINNTETPDLTLGDKCRHAREALNLSLEEVSKQIALRPSILQSIENNQFIHKSIPATFMKGYVRNYAKFLKLPDSVWTGVDFGDVHANDLGKNARATRAVNQYSSHNRWIGWCSVIVILIVAGMTGLWWWESYQQSNVERDNLVQTYVETNSQPSATASHQALEVITPSNTVQSTINPVEIPVNVAVQPAEPVNPVTDVVTQAPIQGSSIAVTTLPLVEQMKTEENMPPHDVTVTNPAHLQPMTSADVLKAEMAKLDEGNHVEQADNKPVSAVTQDELHIEVTGTCWISVKNKNGRVLAQKEYKQGEVLTFNEGGAYSLIIGAPSHVNITYKGEAYPLKVDGRVARFKLPQ